MQRTSGERKDDESIDLISLRRCKHQTEKIPFHFGQFFPGHSITSINLEQDLRGEKEEKRFEVCLNLKLEIRKQLSLFPKITSTTLLEINFTMLTDEKKEAHTIFILVVNETQVHFSQILRFGTEVQQLMQSPRLPITPPVGHAELLEWLLESGLAWLLVQELNIMYPMKRPQQKNTYRYQFGENSFMKYFLYLRDKHGLKPGHKTQLQTVNEVLHESDSSQQPSSENSDLRENCQCHLKES